MARPTKWGNPYKVVGKGNEWYVYNTFTKHLIGDAQPKKAALERALYYYEDRYLNDSSKNLMSQIGELAGKDLACWCKLNEPCHADILIRLANKGMQTNC